MRVRVLGLGALLSCGLTAPASAATLTYDGDRMVYTAAPGEANRVSIARAGDGTITVSTDDPLVADGCTRLPAGPFHPPEAHCPAAASVTVSAGDGDDTVVASPGVPIRIDGGPGDDFLLSGRAVGEIDGGAGDDVLYAAPGDIVRGGTGLDVVHLQYDSTSAVYRISLDGVADDGDPASPANLAPDVEDVSVRSIAAPGWLTGNDGPNRLDGTDLADTITGGGGSDALYGWDGADALFARDGVPDRVDCGAGDDTALVDQYDLVTNCETVIHQPLASPLEDRPPAVDWQDSANARLHARPATTLRVNATDDHAVTKVQFLDDERVLCTDTTAPFTCRYVPRPQDVGRNTLVAIATDDNGQTTSSVRAVEVARFVPRSVSLRVRRSIATGTVRLPEGVPCAGTVTVRAGGAKATGKLSRACRYRAVLRRRGTFTATFDGTATIAPERSAKREVPR